MLHAGHSEVEIADAVGCAASTIHYDIVTLRRQWYDQHLSEVNASVAADLARLDAGIVALWPRVLSGDPKALDSVTRALELKLKAQGVLQTGVRIDFTSYITQMAVEYGYDPQRAIAIAERISAR